MSHGILLCTCMFSARSLCTTYILTVQDAPADGTIESDVYLVSASSCNTTVSATHDCTAVADLHKLLQVTSHIMLQLLHSNSKDNMLGSIWHNNVY